METYEEIVLDTFLQKQEQLFGKPVAANREEAQEILSDCMAFVCSTIREAREAMDESGMDIAGMSDKELAEASEVFALPDGRFLIVEG